MERIRNVTLDEVYELVKQAGFAFWKTSGNHMTHNNVINDGQIQTRVFLSESICILALSMDNEGVESMVSETDFIDIWPSVKRKYPTLFEEGVTGDVCLIP